MRNLIQPRPPNYWDPHSFNGTLDMDMFTWTLDDGHIYLDFGQWTYLLGHYTMDIFPGHGQRTLYLEMDKRQLDLRM